ncbi:MAG: hypothetical protein ACK2T4_06755 [Candidatus Promineifilaceae bacterium]|jgi:hypothetical protein
MDQLLITYLANALETEAANIRDVKAARDGGYNVVLMNYQKFRNVQPKTEVEEKFPREFVEPLVDGDLLPGTTIVLPENLQIAYRRPRRATIPLLKELCRLLDIPQKKRTKKIEIVRAINQWKLENVR